MNPGKAAALRLAVTMGLLLLAGVALPLRLTAQTDVIRGQVTGIDGQPLPGVRVTATSVAGNVTRKAVTNDHGNFQIAFPGASGDYLIGYAMFGYAFRQLEVKRISDEDVLRADARLSPIQLDTMVVIAPLRQRVERPDEPDSVEAGGRAVAAAELSPDMQGDLAAMAASLPGVVLVPGLDGQADGFSVLGLGADQNTTTLNGLQSGTTQLPRDASIASSLVTSVFDPARGGFSGGSLAIRTRPGENIRSRGMSLTATAPGVQWTDGAGRALGSAYTNVSLSGITSGPIARNSSFYNLSFQLGRRSSDNATLLNEDPLGLHAAGVAPDSVARLFSILRGQGLPTTTGDRASRLMDSGSFLGSLDFAPPGSTSGQAVGLTFNGSWNRSGPVGVAATSLPSTGGDHTSWQGGLQARHSGYLGMLLSETSAGLTLARDYDALYADLPAGQVLVSSSLGDGTSALHYLGFGGSGTLGSSGSTLGGSLQSSLSWFDNGNKHRLKVAGEIQLQRNTLTQSANSAGTFTFNSLEDLALGRPTSFTRLLSPRGRTTGLLNGALSLGDSWQSTENLRFTYGLRVDAGTFTNRPTANPLVARTFGVANDRLPAPLAFSPRLGFSWTVGRAQQVSGFSGAARTPRAIIRGGVGVFAGGLSSSALAAALDNTGLADATRQLTCVGSAAPVPEWALYYLGSITVPRQCADGSAGSVFASSSPNVSLMSKSFTGPRSVRTNLAWNGNILDNRLALGVEGIYSLNLHQQRSVDLNFGDTPRFTLGDDGRPVFVAASSIVASTGTVAAQDGRLSPAFARVIEQRSDLRSRSAQVQLSLSPAAHGPSRFGWSASYTLSRMRAQLDGFRSTAGDPLAVDWRSEPTGHELRYNLRYELFDAVTVSWNGWFRSGFAYTPVVSGDINGDGYANDRAFVPDPGHTDDPALAAGMRSLLASAPVAVRRCLERQAGRAAEASSCRGPWTSGAWLNVSLDRAKFRMPERGSVSFSLANPLGAADLLLHGEGNLHGWGQATMPDPTLLYVRGFDATSRRYRFEVNPRFGATRPQVMTMRAPVVLTATVRLDIGPTRERQLLDEEIAARRRPNPGAPTFASGVRNLTTRSIRNPLATILEKQDSLGLTTFQADSVAAMNSRYTYRADSLWLPVVRALAAVDSTADGSKLSRQYLQARGALIDMLAQLGPAVRSLLTGDQRRKLPTAVTANLDPHSLALVRKGTPTYVGGVSSGGDMYEVVSMTPMPGGGIMVIVRSR